MYLNKDETCWIHGSQTMLIQVHVLYTILNNTMLNNILDHKKTNSIFECIALRQQDFQNDLQLSCALAGSNIYTVKSGFLRWWLRMCFLDKQYAWC